MERDPRSLLALLMSRAANAIETHARDPIDVRVEIYGELLVQCAACHASGARPAPRER